MSDDHEWCRDVRRDEAVRAAEDAAAVPAIQHRDLPEIVAELRERVARLEATEKQAASTEAMRCMTKMRRERDDARAERDAAIRERDEANAECERLRGRLATLEPIAKAHEDAIKAAEKFNAEQMGKAITDRMTAYSLVDAMAHGLHAGTKAVMQPIMHALIDQRDAYKARVAELENAAAAQPIGWIARHEQSPPNGKYVMCRWDVSARQGYAREVGYGVAKRGPDGMWRAPNGVEKIAPMHWMPPLPGVEGGDYWESPPAAAPAASAGGEVEG